MNFTAAKSKITTKHLSLLAVIYVRQSSARQVIEHTASAACQRSLADLARHYGWADDMIEVSDKDQGISGRDVARREGFKWLRQQIFEERVGAIICWDASRIARDNSAYAQLIKLCAATNTLVIDEKGVYDPNNDNDRMFLGIIGVLVDNEGRRIADKAVATQRVLAEAGNLRLHAPTGYIRDDEGKLVRDPDKKVQAAFRLFFSTFDKCESVSQLIKHYNRKGIKFPTCIKGKAKKRSVTWVELSVHRAIYVLRNPAYAGAYAFGRLKSVDKMVSAETTEQKKKRVHVSLDSDEVILIHNTHAKYITWEKFTQNQQRINDNKYLFGAGCSGAVRNGPALLQGIVKCAHCNRSMRTTYNIIKGKKRFSYQCDSGVREFGRKICTCTSAYRLDEAVTEALLEALSPAQMQMTLRALDEADADAKADARQQHEAVKQAQAEVEVARREYKAIDPCNRLVAAEYEKELEEKLTVAKRLEAKQAKAQKGSARRSADEVRQSLLKLDQDVRLVWECAAVTYAERKRVLRCLITKVTLKKRTDIKGLDVAIHWVTGAITPLVVMDGRYRHPGVVELMRTLAPDHTVSQIVERLNQSGFKPVHAKSFSRNSVYLGLQALGIKNTCPERSKKDMETRGDGRYSARATATRLNVSKGTVVRWGKRGLLDGVRDSPRGAYWFKLSPEQISELKKVQPTAQKS